MRKIKNKKNYRTVASRQLQFIEKLQLEARHQSKLQAHTLLPRELNGVAELIIRFPWQFLLVSSFVSTVMLEFLSSVKWLGLFGRGSV
jgi:hypothetical protein